MKKTKFIALIVACLVCVAAIVGGSIWWASMSNKDKGSSASSTLDTAQWNEIIKNMKIGKVYSLWGHNFLCVAEGNETSGTAAYKAGRKKIKTLWIDSSAISGTKTYAEFVGDGNTDRTDADSPNKPTNAGTWHYISRWSSSTSNDSSRYNQQTYLHSVFNEGVSGFVGTTLSGTDTQSVYEKFNAIDSTLTSLISPGYKSTNSADKFESESYNVGAPLYADDYFWAPSYIEVENNGTWGLDNDKRKWESPRTYTTIGKNPSDGGTTYTGASWLRSPSTY
ncbi:MAG: hypothetical protein LBH47_00245, partial [Christensenellaceae bacterium]|nr:hypothetical protein [Christensenellaceae bacterium]